ncbi:hypothetical protein AMTR_s00144p00028290 [Amborella trichopoda]|uniref:Aminotransferase-like plant mobile domain-containing protein n=1 Tax=Amborella trichopoda TaxID=13333 RepID=W1P6T1_AMBTC|nr:hypothetical protein AMTR_s00144p00028290 [Amborella trichopoda]
MVSPLVSLSGEEWREQERERIRDAYERAMIEDEPEVWAWEHVTIPRPLPSRLAPSFVTIHHWSYGVWEIEEIDSLPMRVDSILAVYVASSQSFRMTAHLICIVLVMPYFPGRVSRQFGLPQSFFEITPPWTPLTARTADEDAYMREMTQWIEEWRHKTARVISEEEEEEGISLPLYEERTRLS